MLTPILTLSILLIACTKTPASVDSAPPPVDSEPEVEVGCDRVPPEAKGTWTVLHQEPFEHPMWSLTVEAWDADGDLDVWTLHGWFNPDPDAVIDTSREPDWVANGARPGPCQAFEILEVGFAGPIDPEGPQSADDLFFPGNTFAVAIAIIDAHDRRSEPHRLAAEIPEGL